MDIIGALGALGSAFGLSASAGLNAYIPLLVVSLAARFTNLINLSEPYDILASWPVIGVLTVLLIIEVFVDKIPAVDTLNDIVSTLIRPTAGAVLFAANSNVIEMSPYLAAIAGLLVAGSVHATKGAIRPAVTAGTAGTGNWVVSIIEDVIAFFASIMAIFLPLIIGIITIVGLFFGGRFYFKRRAKHALPTAY